jgi:hypothetical protein
MCREMDNISWSPGFVSIPPQRGESNTNLGDHDTSKSQKPWFTISPSVEGFT